MNDEPIPTGTLVYVYADRDGVRFEEPLTGRVQESFWDGHELVYGVRIRAWYNGMCYTAATHIGTTIPPDAGEGV